MLKNTRSICLDVCNYENQVVCKLYDNTGDISGQATDVFVRTERNGWKELSFRIPSTCITEEGVEENFRLQFLIADYRIRLQTDKETDWYLISEPRITHNAKAKEVEVRAGHICQLLKTKNLALEFSDEEGNNVGTAEQLLTTILEGTGWSVGNVAIFLEDDGVTEKVRSIVAPVKTGAFKLISDMCEKFNAKPIYRGDGRIVDIVPLNPFSEVEGAEIPKEVLEGENVIELYYDRNVTQLNRTLNTENLVTRLYAYGAYGDKTNGLCSLQTCSHREYTLKLPRAYSASQEFMFKDYLGAKYYFTLKSNKSANSAFIWSDLDRVSRSYVWDGSTYCEIYKEPKSTYVELSTTVETVKNWFEYLSDFRYYDKVGLLSDTMKQKLAEHQRNMPAYIEASTEASAALIECEEDLSRYAESNSGFLRLNVDSYLRGSNGELILNIHKTNAYPSGVMYRSDYDEARKNYFSWYCTTNLDDNGDPISGIGSVVYIVHNTTPTTWEKAYVKYIDGNSEPMDYSTRGVKDPDQVTLWLSYDKVGTAPKSGDRFYLFSTNSISGRLGVKESELESLQQSLSQSTKVVTEQHPTYFVWDNEAAPPIDGSNPKYADIRSSYGWYYRAFSNNTNFGELYFLYGIAGETGWKRALIQETTPSVIAGGYFFNMKSKELFHGESGEWVNIADSGILVTSQMYYAPNAEAKRLSQSFSKVAYYCLRHDMLYKGLYDKYNHTVTANPLTAGNYAFKNDYGFYWVFSTDMSISKGKTIYIDTLQNLVYQDEHVENVVKPEAKSYEVIDFPVANELSLTTFLQGSVVKTTGIEENSNSIQRTNNMTVYPGVTYQYSLPSNSYVVLYDSNRRYLSYTNTSGSGTFKTTERTKYIRVVCPTATTASHYVRVYDYTNKLFIKDKQYTILANSGSGDRMGIVKLIKAFADTADSCYMTYLPAYQTAQDAIKQRDDALKETLGDMYREGYWQDTEYVEGDENKLYTDALDNMDKIAKPEATYEVSFLDLYTANQDMGFKVDESLEDVEWPDIEITDAAHLIDEDIDVNCWAFIDVINKCYDKPWQTTLEINTDLSLIGQHSFTDVISRIAEVADETKGRQTLYERASYLSGSGKLTAANLEGAIKANVNLLQGGASNWYTDSKGNMIFESADGQSAMMFTGYGWAVANSRGPNGSWDWRYTATGQGMTADFITAGEINANLLVAGSITTDKINASVGQELEIGSNKALLLYATVDGYRPSGGLETQVSNGDGTYRPVAEGDSYISIKAKEGNRPAQIDIMTGGIMNLQGSTMNLLAKSTMNLTSGDMYVDAAGKIHMKSGSDMDIEGGASITVEAQGDINLKANSDMSLTGATMDIQSGSTLKIGSNSNMYLQSNANMYIQSQGRLAIQSGSYFSVDSPNFLVTEAGDVMARGTIYALLGQIAGIDILGDYNAQTKKWSNQRIQAGGTNSMASTAKGFYIATDGINMGGKFKYTAGTSTTPSILYVEAEQVLVGKQTSGSGTLLSMNAATGIINLAASSTINVTASSTVNVSGGEKVVIAAGDKVVSGVHKYGYVQIGNAGSPFTVSSNGVDAYIYNGVTSMTSNDSSGIYLGTNGIRLGAKGVFEVNTAGAITATSANIMGEIKANTGRIGGKMVEGTLTGGWYIIENMIYADNKTVGMSAEPPASGKTEAIRFWAGDTTKTSAEFYVTNLGYMKSTSGSIAGWDISDTTLMSTNQKIGMYSGTGNDNEIAYWAGSTTPKDANFNVTHGGALTAVSAKLKSAQVEGNIYAGSGNIGGTVEYNADNTVKTVTGGWRITSNTLYSNNYATGLSSANGDTTIAIWAGASASDKISTAKFRVTRAGIVTADGGIFNNASVDGTIEAVSGKIGPEWKDNKWTGGWDIVANTISSGAGTTYVAMSSNTGSDYAIWAGNATASSANFYVKRNGYLYAKEGEFTGTITAGVGSVIGGWYIGSDRIRNGNTSSGGSTGMGSGTNSSDITFWAGATYKDNAMDLDNTQYYVTAGGSLVARSVDVSGTIKATSLSIGGTNAAFTVDDKGVITGLTFTSDKSKTAGFTFDSSGRFQISASDVGANAGSNVKISTSGITLATTGDFEISSGNFVVKDGDIQCISGTIGAWVIDDKELTSDNGDIDYHDGMGNVSTFVGLSTDPANAYAIWCGNKTAGDAPFRVRRNGLCYVTKVVDLDEEGHEQIIDLGKYSLGKLQYSTVVSVGDDGTVKLSNGKTFDTAASVSISGNWSGTTFGAKAKTKSGVQVDSKDIKVLLSFVVDKTLGQKEFAVGVFPDGVTPVSGNSLDTISMALKEDKTKKEVTVISGSVTKAKIDTSDTYNAGKDYADGLYSKWNNGTQSSLYYWDTSSLSYKQATGSGKKWFYKD